MKMNILLLILYLPWISSSASYSSCRQANYTFKINESIAIWTYTLKDEFSLQMWLGEDTKNTGNCSDMLNHELYEHTNSKGMCSNHTKFKIIKNTENKFTFPGLESNTKILNTMGNEINLHLDPGWNHLEFTLLNNNVLHINKIDQNYISTSKFLKMQDFSECNLCNEKYDFGSLTDPKLLTCPYC
ncbi:unnamed protein product, partial [Meganyctiphanes norvegica]